MAGRREAWAEALRDLVYAVRARRCAAFYVLPPLAAAPAPASASASAAAAADGGADGELGPVLVTAAGVGRRSTMTAVVAR